MFELAYVLVILIIANLAVGRRALALLTYGLLILTNLALLVFGAGISLLGSGALPADAGAPAAATLFTPSSGLLVALTGLIGFVPLVPAVRRGLSSVLPVEADNPVHVTAFVFTVYLVGGTLAQFAIDISSLLAEAGTQITVRDLWIQGALFTAFGIVGVGIFLRRSGGDALKRLGLVVPTREQVTLAGIVVAGFLLLDFVVSYAWFTIAPDSYNQLSDLTGELFRNLSTPLGALSLGLTAGIGEEILFRGALQPRFGIVLTSILFALGHTQYALSPALVEVFLIGLILGIIRARENTTTTVLIHVAYNTLNVLLSPLWPG